ncbi:GNAT family N-acetyltransferase [Arvimicrobium flavum]|uniref:GNAT family N-acetyltransferase n=1 Tax=Arvimicrobium flavum TaxID=3393320 RepID=UPI00237B6FB8|nr:GNAT family N-acetyltransferase [Mesorhizobium shangrilense]
MTVIESNGVRTGPAHAVGVDDLAISAYYRETWARPVSLSLPRFYRWQFVAPPENEGLDWNCVAVRDGAILGVMGLNRRTFLLDGRPRRAAELTTWVVSEAARGLGVGKGIMQSLQATHDFMVGFGISEMAMPIYAASGFRRLGQIPRYFRVLDEAAVAHVARIDPLGRRLIAHGKGGTDRAYHAREAEAASLGEIGAAASGRANLFKRDAAALAWRYEDHPVFDYRLYHVTDAARPGTGAAVILRSDETGGLRFLHVVDVFGDPADMDAAVAFIDGFARDTGAAFADVTCSHSATAGHFLAADWFSTNDDYFCQLSHLFYPFELRQPQTTSAVVWSRDDRAQAFDFGRLMLTKGDLDLDRPTIAYYEAHGRAQE